MILHVTFVAFITITIALTLTSDRPNEAAMWVVVEF
jgi:hypothetical protein